MCKKNKFHSHIQISFFIARNLFSLVKVYFFSEKKINSFQHSDTAKNGTFLAIKSEFY